MTMFAKSFRRVGDILAHPSIIPLWLRGVPARLTLSLDASWLRSVDIRTVVDVGANTGQFALAAHHFFPTAAIHCFEPLPDAFRDLQRRTQRVANIRAWNLALGDRSGSVAFQRNDYTPSSSLLPLALAHVEAFPFASRTSSTQAAMRTLDDFAAGVSLAEPILVKVDVQGFEDRVISGGSQTLMRTKIAIVETSFEKLYEGQMMHSGVCELLQRLGFSYAGAIDQLRHPRTGRILAADSLFLK